MKVWVTYEPLKSIYTNTFCIWSIKPKYNILLGIWEPTEDYWNKYFFSEFCIPFYNKINSKINLQTLIGSIKPVEIEI